MILSLVLAVALGVGGTLAYLTDDDGDVNVMVVGNVQITQNEQQRVDQGEENSELEEFEQNKAMAPIVDKGMERIPQSVNGWDITMRNEDTYRNYVDKIVSVTNTGSSDAYVRTLLAFPTKGYDSGELAFDEWLHWNYVSSSDTLETPTQKKNGWMWGTEDNKVEWPNNTKDWNAFYNVDIDGEEYTVYIATNELVLAPGETTAPTLVGMYLDAAVDNELVDGKINYYVTKNGKKFDLGDISKLEVLVLSQAVQADGFDSAWEAFDAAFPTDDEDAVVEWMSAIEQGTPGDKNDTNNPPTLADYKVKNNTELLAAIEEAAAAGEPAVIELAAGDYDNIDLNGINNLTLRGAKGAEVKVSGIDLVRNENGKIGVNGLTLENIDFVDRGVTVDFTTGSPWNRIDGLTIRNCTYTGANMDDVVGNRLFDICAGSPGSNQLFDLTIEGCEVTTAIQGIRMGGLDGTTTIKNNTITDVGHNAIALRSGRSDCLIEGNTITNGGDRAFRIATISGGTVTYKNNTIVNTGEPVDGSNFKANTIDASASVVFEGNTVDGAAWSGI